MKIKPKHIIISVSAILSILLLKKMATTKFLKITQSNKKRGCDVKGCGHFGASRGDRKHNGLDIVTIAGEPIYAPVSGKVVRHSFPYSDDLKYTGLLLENSDLKIHIWYFKPIVSAGTTVKAGDILGYAQDLTKKYKGITNHVHLEVKDQKGKLINPETLV